MGANDPRRQRWMTLAVENLLTSERADQIMESIKGLDVLSPEFDAFLAAQIKLATLYPTRGKLKRLRDFLAELRAKGETQAAASWQVSRSMLRMPPIPPLDGAGRAQSLLWALLQGSTTIAETPVEQLDNMFFAVLNFSREQVIRNKSWDWAVALDMLEAEARTVPRPVPVQKKAGLFGGGKPQPVCNQPDRRTADRGDHSAVARRGRKRTSRRYSNLARICANAEPGNQLPLSGGTAQTRRR